MKLRDRTIADKILEYCGEIENILVRLNHTEEAFRKDKGLSAGAVFYIAQIGELSAHFSEDARDGAAVYPSVRSGRSKEYFAAFAFRPPIENVVLHCVANAFGQRQRDPD